MLKNFTAVHLFLSLMLIAPITFAKTAKSAEIPSFKGRLFLYEKSNLDGSNKGRIATYYLGENVIESFKWHEGSDHATKVRATMNSQSLDASLLEALGVDRTGNEEKYAELRAGANGTFNMLFGNQKSTFHLPATHWHSYDFDFAGLGYAYPHYPSKKEISFHIFDIDMYADTKPFIDFGTVKMTFVDKDNHLGHKALKYKIDGAGLDDRGGFIWFHEKHLYLLGFEIKKPDEPGYDSGKMQLMKVINLTQEQWLQFQMDALSSSTPPNTKSSPVAEH